MGVPACLYLVTPLQALLQLLLHLSQDQSWMKLLSISVFLWNSGGYWETA